jgi:hypothetical protein
MTKTIAALVAVAGLVASIASAQAGLQLNTDMQNAMNPNSPTVNSLTFNGLTNNSLSTNSLTTNSLSFNGVGVHVGIAEAGFAVESVELPDGTVASR